MNCGATTCAGPVRLTKIYCDFTEYSEALLVRHHSQGATSKQKLNRVSRNESAMSVSRNILWRQIRLAIFFALAVALLLWLGNLLGRRFNFDEGGMPARVPIHGTVVNAEGRNGLMRFTPLTANGILADGEFTDGAFQFDDSNGPSAGRHRVHVMLELKSPEQPGQKSKTAVERRKTNKTPPAPRYDQMIELEVIVPSEAPYQVELELP